LGEVKQEIFMSWLTRKFPRLGELIGDFHARRRGERRVAPYGSTGRVYERVNPSSAGDHQAAGRGKATLEMKITRANGKVERRIVLAKLTRK
jgi:hypothetical protein